MINAHSANLNVSDYCAAFQRNEIVVNRDYQRSDRVWPDAAKSYLIESILLGFPIPKFYFNLKADLKNRRTVKEIVDGQQRTAAIVDFFNDRFPLSNTLGTEEIRGMKYETLSEKWQNRFLSYLLSIDQFVGIDESQVREVFRRMNSYTVPLNPEELRHAENQGQFKWFINKIGAEFTDDLAALGVFTSKTVVRMQDLKLYTEIVHALDKGVTTTSRKDLDKIYKMYDDEFKNEYDYFNQIDYAFSEIRKLRFLSGTNLAKSYQIYSIALAFIKEYKNSCSTNQDRTSGSSLDSKFIEWGFLELSAALDIPEDAIKNSPHMKFIQASKAKTNVKDQRIVRINSFYEVLRQARRSA